MGRPQKYPPESRERALRSVAAKLGIGSAEMVRQWGAGQRSTPGRVRVDNGRA